jgi:hypothetical protein
VKRFIKLLGVVSDKERYGAQEQIVPRLMNFGKNAADVHAVGPRISSRPRRLSLATITTKDGTEIYYKDWGSGPARFFHHGWPLSTDDWDRQMMFFLERDHG